MRVEQYNRYLVTAGEDYAPATMEDTVSDEEGTPVDTSHRNYDEKVLIFFRAVRLPLSLFMFCAEDVARWRRRRRVRIS